MISIVIPLYNKEKFIAQTLQSVLNQTYPTFEVVVVDDGSTDNSVKVVKSFHDKRIKLITIKNSGVSVARNTGIKNASHNWIAFLDADDWWGKTFLEEIVNAQKTHTDKKVFATGRTLLFKTKNSRYINPFLPQDGKTATVDYIKIISKYLPPVNSSNTVLHKSLFEQKGYFNPNQKKHEDHDLWLRLLYDVPVIFINKPLSFYRKTETNSASRQVYLASDFCTYINTLSTVYKKLDNPLKNYFSIYLNTFLLLTYIKNYQHYSKEEDNRVYLKILPLVTYKNKIILKTLKLLPFKNTYSILKKLKK